MTNTRIGARLGAVLALALMVAPGAGAQDRPQLDTIEKKVAGCEKLDGFVPLYWDAQAGRMYMEISRFGTELLYQVALATGLGSNPVGLDKGQPGGARVVVFDRVGPRVLMVQRNYRYRALTDDLAERRAVDESFAQSVVWGFAVAAASGDRVLVDATEFFLRDAHGVGPRLRDTSQGSYRVDDSRSAIFLPRTKGFPKNTEVEATLTFVSDGPTGDYVNQTAPTPGSITLREHHSFVELPGPGFTPRRADPRVGAIFLEFYDYASPIDASLEQRYVVRHRLQKKDPTAAISDPVEPIVYYVDNAAPEPIRSALVDGASWWNQAFEAAGFRNAFQVRVLPADADPMDIRYNIIRWVHRSTRGWSYGGSVADPRTGEIIKGSVTLGSLRVRQDYILGSGFVPPHSSGACAMAEAPDFSYLAEGADADAVKMSLARIRQLSAHEVGHAIGLAHNFAASTYGRASVMDYPAPMVEIKNGRLDLSNAYATGIGAYDKFAISYSYSQFAPGTNEQAALRKLVRDGVAAGMLYLSDDDARPASAANPLANLWDNGPDPVATLEHEMEVRRIAMRGFDLRVLADGEPLSLLESRFLPLYLHNRYQIDAAVKTIGGVRYTYAVKDGAAPNPNPAQQIVSPVEQRRALAVVLSTLDPKELAIPPKLLDLIPPPADGFVGGRIEDFDKRTSPTFDPIGAATIAADLVVPALLEPHRAARLIDFHARDAANPGFSEVVDALIARVWAPGPRSTSHEREIARAVQRLVVTRLVGLAGDDSADSSVRAVASAALRRLSARLGGPPSAGDEAAHRGALRDEIERFLSRPDEPRRRTAPLSIPAGQPIGQP